MPKAVMCLDGRDCELREHCFRYRAIPDKDQRWECFNKKRDMYGRCNFYSKLRTDDNLRTVGECDEWKSTGF